MIFTLKEFWSVVQLDGWGLFWQTGKLRRQISVAFLLATISILMNPIPALAEENPSCMTMADLSSGQVSEIEGVLITPCSDDAASQLGLTIGGRYKMFSVIAGPRFGPPNTRYFRLSRHALFNAGEFKEYPRSQQILDMAFLDLITDENETDPLKPIIWFRFLRQFSQLSDGRPNQEEWLQIEWLQMEKLSQLRFDEILKKMGKADLIGIDIRCAVWHDIPRHKIQEIIETVAYKNCAKKGE